MINLQRTVSYKYITDLFKAISNFQKGYQPTTDTVKNENDDLLTDSQSISARWKNHFSQLLNIRVVNYISQTEIQTAEPLVPEPSDFDVELAIEKLTRHKSPGTDQILAELINPYPANVDNMASSYQC